MKAVPIGDRFKKKECLDKSLLVEHSKFYADGQI